MIGFSDVAQAIHLLRGTMDHPMEGATPDDVPEGFLSEVRPAGDDAVPAPALLQPTPFLARPTLWQVLAIPQGG